MTEQRKVDKKTVAFLRSVKPLLGVESVIERGGERDGEKNECERERWVDKQEVRVGCYPMSE